MYYMGMFFVVLDSQQNSLEQSKSLDIKQKSHRYNTIIELQVL